MSAAVQSIIIALAGLVLAIILGSQLGTGFRIVPLAFAIAVVVFASYKLLFKAIRIEALILGILIFGYLVGNRGFAQLSLAPHTPIYLGEVGMVACVAILLARLALNREQLIPRTPLSWAIMAFILIGAVRLACDVFLGLSPADTTTTIRDSATVYYSLFFFIAYKVASHAVGRRLVERFVLAGCILLLPVFLIQFVFAPELFQRLTFRGYPLIAHKGDLTAAYLAFASFYFLLQPARGILRIASRALAVLFFAGMFIVTARAAIVGYVGAVLLLLLARRPQFVIAQAVTAVVALLIVGSLRIGASADQNEVYTKLADKVESITDVTGSRTYRGEVGDSAADNNQFRVIWWKSVFNDTVARNPLFGLGFGYDLSASFVRKYYSNMQDPTWDTRSPHSVWVTILGRMGFIGLASFSLVVFLLIREAIFSARLVARRQTEASTLAFWIGTIIILGSASFGVVLEGPMGGILFWSFLGFASSQLHLRRKAEEILHGDALGTSKPGLRRPGRLVPA